MFDFNILLLIAGDVERNPGPPKAKAGPPGGRPKEPTKEGIMASLKTKVNLCCWKKFDF